MLLLLSPCSAALHAGGFCAAAARSPAEQRTLPPPPAVAAAGAASPVGITCLALLLRGENCERSTVVVGRRCRCINPLPGPVAAGWANGRRYVSAHDAARPTRRLAFRHLCCCWPPSCPAAPAAGAAPPAPSAGFGYSSSILSQALKTCGEHSAGVGGELRTTWGMAGRPFGAPSTGGRKSLFSRLRQTTSGTSARGAAITIAEKHQA